MPGCVSEISKDPNFTHLIQECGETRKLTVGETRQKLTISKEIFVWSSETKNLYLKGIQNEAVGLGGLHNNGIDKVFLRNIIRGECMANVSYPFLKKMCPKFNNRL